MSGWTTIMDFTPVRGVPYLTTSQYERIDSANWRSVLRSFKLENNAWIEVTSELPQGTSVLLEHGGSLYSGTNASGVWKIGLPSSDVAEMRKVSTIQIYPNPTVDRITIQAESSNFRIYNAVGQDVTSLTSLLDEQTLSVRALDAGVYQLVIDSETIGFVKY